ncbi:hypothetical protein B4Q13_20690, partial [Lacticaseibacillus rhamnosus]
MYASRGADSADGKYSNRWTLATLASIDAFTNTSSALGVKYTSVLPNDSTRMMGANLNYSLIRYDGIAPGFDGEFV